MSSDALTVARRNLNEVLNEKAARYFGHMKKWFRMKLTKDEFDMEARKLLSPDQVHFHNDFLLALLNKVQGLAEISLSMAQERNSSLTKNNRRQKKPTRASDNSGFDAVDLVDYLPQNSPPGAGSDGVKYAVQEIFLPDHALVVGRFMLAAWELGLESVDDDAADIIVVAIQHFLKNIISAVISQRKGYKTRNKHFKYDVGGEMPNMWLMNTNKLYDPQAAGRVNVEEDDDALGSSPTGLDGLVPRCPPTIDEMEHSAAYEIACSVPNKVNDDKITLQELYHTLQTDRNIVACQSVYAVNMERIALMLNHPSE